jgi:AcrR family transcriptional regulator
VWSQQEMEDALATCHFWVDKNERSYYFDFMIKGENTKRAILDAGLKMSTQLSLESITIGNLAKATRMSKSGLFAHFKSKENLQVEILKHAGELFAEGVVIPALRVKAGIPRIKALVNNWIKWSSKMTGGCIFVSASTEFADRPGNVRDFILEQQAQWIDSLRRIARAAIRVEDFRKDMDCDQFAFDLYSLLLGFHLYDKMLNNADTQMRQETALERLLDHYRYIAQPSPSREQSTVND